MQNIHQQSYISYANFDVVDKESVSDVIKKVNRKIKNE